MWITVGFDNEHNIPILMSEIPKNQSSNWTGIPFQLASLCSKIELCEQIPLIVKLHNVHTSPSEI